MNTSLLFGVVFALAITQVLGRGEILNRDILVQPMRAACITNAFVRPCPITRGAALLDAAHLPDDWQCPCPISNPADGSGNILNPTGSRVQANPDNGFFVDEVLVNGFDNPIGMSFSDSSPELFVATRNGLVWYCNLQSGEKKIFMDINLEVGLSGDRGLMDIVLHPNFNNVHQLLVQYTVDPTPNDGVEPDAESAVNQRVIRVADLGGGVLNQNFRLYVIGPGDGDGVPICFNTHAVGTLKFGLDGSLIMTTGEGSHWNFDMGDWGQDALVRFDAQGNSIPSIDPECIARFGASEDVGAWRSQIYDSLSGKVLRIAPDSGDGICVGSATGGGYPIKNPFCDGTSGVSKRSKVWAVGARNPFRATVRPFQFAGEPYFGGPGTVYFGDVGQGGYEEVNAVTQSGLNFGWPCWEGPMPSPMYRDALYNSDGNYQFDRGCGGLGAILGPCGNITTIARDENGNRWSCPLMYKNHTTTLPFFFWSRFRQNDNAGYFSECGYTGQGFYGATTAGLQFYTGNKYPTKYKNALFALEFSYNWIKVLFVGPGDQFLGVQDFADLIYTPPVDGAKVTLNAGPDGNICYITMNGGEVRCFRYVATNLAPTVVAGAVENSGVAPLTVQFKADGTYDRENDQITLRWSFGDNSADSFLANPQHTYTSTGTYTAYLFATDKFGNTANSSITIYVGNARPKVAIYSPTATAGLDRTYVYTAAEIIQFKSNITDESVNTCTVRWELQIVHNNHIHTDILNLNQRDFNLSGSAVPNEGVLERNNARVVLHVTDALGLEATDFFRLSPQGWDTLWGGNQGPVISWNWNTGYLPLEVGQPVKFDASATLDPNGDRVDYAWDFGDGFTASGVTTSHVYATPGNFTVKITASDNWGNKTSAQGVITVQAQTALSPAVYPETSEQYEDWEVTMSTVQPAGTIYYTVDGSDPTGASTVYNAPFNLTHVRYTTRIVKARTYAGGVNPSAIITSNYTLLPPPCNVLAISSNCSLVCYNPVQRLKTGYLQPIAPANNINYAGVRPTDNFVVLRYLIDRLFGTYDASKNYTSTSLWVDGGSTPGQAVQLRMSYDWTNDGSWDRVELFNLFACDPVPDVFEAYASQLPQRFQTITGNFYQNFNNGTVMVEIWQALGPGAPQMRLKTNAALENQLSTITLPYSNMYQDGPNAACDLYCNGRTFTVDSCGTCNGPGPVGCDSQCFSTKAYDVCGTCGGPGKTGCDNSCFSNLVVDTCGACGGNSTCVIPGGSLGCGTFGIRNRCPDMICNTVLTTTPDIATIPSPNATITPGNFPTNPQLVLTYLIQNVTGYYNIDQQFTSVQLYLDSGAVPSTGVSTRISYDWTGDGSYERVEFWDFFPPNDLAGFEKFVGLGTPNSQTTPNGKLITGLSTLPAWRNLTDGVVRVEFWQALTSTTPVYLKTDGVDASGHVSLVTIPFITAWRPPYQGIGPCGQPALIVTTGDLTTSPLTTSPLTTSPLTTGGITTGKITSGALTSGVRVTTSVAPATTGNGAPVTTGSVPGTTGVASVTTAELTTGTDACTGFQCNDPSDSICIVSGSGRCVIALGNPQCQYTNVNDNTACEVNQPPNLCYTGTCQGGSCVAGSGGFNNCNEQSASEESSASIFQISFVIVGIFTALF